MNRAMRFRNFLEARGYFDDKEDTRPRGLGRYQEMPGTTMVPSTSTTKGKVVDVEFQDDEVILKIQDGDDDMDEDDKTTTHIRIPTARYHRERERAPNMDDIVQAEFDRDNKLISYEVIHRA